MYPSRACNNMKIIGENYHFEIFSSVVQKINYAMKSLIPLSKYVSKLEEHVQQPYLQKSSSIGVDPALIKCKHFEHVNPPSILLGFVNKLLHATTI